MEDVNQKEPKTKTPKKKKKKRRLVKFFLAVLIFAAILQTVFYFFATPILRSYIQNKVFTKTNGLYTISFEKIVLDLSTRSLRFENFHLSPDTALYRKYVNEGKLKKGIYDFKFNYIEFQRIKLWRLVKKSQLKINKVIISSPEVVLRNLPRASLPKRKKYDAIHRDLPFVLSKYFKSVDIDEIILNNGLLDFYVHNQKNKKSSIAKVSGHLFNFHINPNIFQTNHNFLFSDNIYLKINGYSLELNDSIHNVKSDSVIINTTKNSILIYNSSLYPKDSSNVITSKDIYNIKIPRIKLSGFDIDSVYFDKKISLCKLEFDSSQIRITSPPKPKYYSKNTTKKFRIEQLISGIFKNISVDTFLFKDANLQIQRSTATKSPEYTINKFSVKLTDFLVDSQSLKRKDKIFYSKDIELKINNFKMILNDNFHNLTADVLNISTTKNYIEAKNVNVFPQYWISSENARKLNKTIIKCTVPEVMFTGINIRQAYNYEVLPIEQLLLNRPNISIYRYTAKDSTQNKTKKQNYTRLYGFVSHFLNTVKINKLCIDSAHFSIKNLRDTAKQSYTESGIHLNMTNFIINGQSELDSTSTKIFNTEQFDLQISNYKMKLADNLHTIGAKSIFFSSIDSIIEINDITIQPAKSNSDTALLKKYGKSSLLNFKIPSVIISKIDFRKLYYNKYLLAKEILMDNPILDIKTFEGLRKSRDSILVQIADTMHEFKKLLVSKIANEQQLETDSGLFFCKKNDSVVFHSKTPLFLSRINMQYIYPAPMKVYSDTIKFSGIDSFSISQKSLWRISSNDTLLILHKNKKIVSINDSIYLLATDSGTWFVRPNFTKKLSHCKTFYYKPQSSFDFYELLAHYMDSISIDKISQTNGLISYLRMDLKGNKLMEFKNEAELQLYNFQLNNDSNFIKNKSLLKENLIVKFSKFNLDLPSKIYGMYANEVILSTFNRCIILKNLEINANKENIVKNGTRNAFYGIFPKITIENVDLEKLADKKQLEAERIMIDSSIFNISTRSEIPKLGNFDFTKKLFKLSLPKKLKEIKADTVIVENSKLQFSDFDNNKNKTSSLFKLKLYNMLLDTTLHYQNTFSNILYSDNFDFTLLNFQKQLPDKIHTLFADTLEISTISKYFCLKQVVLDYTPSLKNYNYLSGTNNKMLIYLKMPKAELSGLHFDSLFMKKKLIINNIGFIKPQIDISQSKRIGGKKISLKDIDFTEKFLPIFKEVHIYSINIEDVSLERNDIQEEFTKTNLIKNLSAQLERFDIDSFKDSKTEKLMNADNINLRLHKLALNMKDSLYVLQTKDIRVNSKTSDVTVDSISYFPRINERELFLMNYTKPILRISGDKIIAKSADIFQFLENKKFIANKLIANDFRFDISQKYIKHDKDSVVKQPTFQEYFYKFNTSFTFDTILLNNSNFTYTSESPRSREIAHIFINNFNGEFFNFSNDTSFNKKKNLKINLNGNLLNEALLNVKLEFPLRNKEGKFEMSGNLGKMDLAKLNAFLRPAALIETQGNNDNLTFNMFGTNSAIFGNLNWRYKNLRINVLKSKDIDTSYSKSGFKSFLANRIIRSSNPKRRHTFEKHGFIYTERDTGKTFTNYWFAGIISGTKSIMGINSKMQRELKKNIPKKPKNLPTMDAINMKTEE